MSARWFRLGQTEPVPRLIEGLLTEKAGLPRPQEAFPLDPQGSHKRTPSPEVVKRGLPGLTLRVVPEKAPRHKKTGRGKYDF